LHYRCSLTYSGVKFSPQTHPTLKIHLICPATIDPSLVTVHCRMCAVCPCDHSPQSCGSLSPPSWPEHWPTYC
jgi:hypothetical protein